MIVRSLEDARTTDRRVVTSNWESVRLVLQDDGVGFSFHISTMYPGSETRMWYKNHFEVVYCLEGEGEIECLSDGVVHPIAPGTTYVLDQHDRHVLRAKTKMVNACVFSPALHGKEVHDADGAYPREAEPVTS